MLTFFKMKNSNHCKERSKFNSLDGQLNVKTTLIQIQVMVKR